MSTMKVQDVLTFNCARDEIGKSKLQMIKVLQ